MNYVYVLKSTKDDGLYLGSTRDLKSRVGDHNAGRVNSTKLRKPFSLVYYEAYIAEGDARQRERSLKLRGQALQHLRGRISESLLQSVS